MTKLARILLTATAAFPAAHAAAQQPSTPPAPAPYPHQADIVRAEPFALGPAGEERPDISRFLLVRGAGQPILSPDGSRVVYTSNITGTPQLFSVPSSGGFPDQLTYGHGVDWITPSPDGRHVLYGADTDGDERVAMNLISYDGTRERTVVAKSPAFRTFGAFASDGRRFAYSSTERNGTDFDIYVADVETGQSRRVYEGRYGFYVSSWQPNGDLLAVLEQRGETGSNLHLLNARTGELTTVYRPERQSAYTNVEWLPDGSGFYLVTDHERDRLGVSFYDVRTRQLRRVVEGPHDVGQIGVSHDGRYLAWTTIESGFERLHLRDLRTNRDVALPQLPAGTIGFQFAQAAAMLGIQVNGPHSPGAFHVYDIARNRLTLAVPVDAPGLDLSQMVVPQPVAFRARDGAPLTGLLYMPRHALGGSRPPVFLSLHGGPSAHATPTYRADVQYYLSRGIAVLDFNYRGSTGQGRAFAELNDRELKANEAGDVADAVAWLRANPAVDGSRVAVGGGSYGGYLTNLALGTYPDMFVAGVSSVGVADWVTALEGASPALKASDRMEFGDISDPAVRAFFSRLSPINNAERIRTPLIVLHGANDPRDPVTESDRLVERIRAGGGQVTYLRFPDEGHGITRLANRVHAYRRIAAFLEEQFSRGR